MLPLWADQLERLVLYQEMYWGYWLCKEAREARQARLAELGVSVDDGREMANKKGEKFKQWSQVGRVPQLFEFGRGRLGLTRLQEKFTTSKARVARLVKDLGARRMLEAEANGEPGREVDFRMYRHSGVTGRELDESDSDSSDHSAESETPRAALEGGSGRRKRLLGGKLILQLLDSGWGGV